jgi:hypothetical protein
MNPARTPSTPPGAGATSSDATGVGARVDASAWASTLGPGQDLEDVALLLHQASLAAWEIGDREGLISEMHYLGLGVYLAQGNTVALLPADHVMSQSWPPVGPPAENDPGRLVDSVEKRLRALRSDAAPGLSDLVLEVCDLAREFREHTELDRIDREDRVDRARQAEEAQRHGS